MRCARRSRGAPSARSRSTVCSSPTRPSPAPTRWRRLGRLRPRSNAKVPSTSCSSAATRSTPTPVRSAPSSRELCDLPFLGGVRHLAIDGTLVSARCEHDDGWLQAEVHLPAILSCAERLIEPAKVDPPERAQVAAGRIRRVSAADLGPGPWGQAASPTSVGPVKVMAVTRARQRPARRPAGRASTRSGPRAVRTRCTGTRRRAGREPGDGRTAPRPTSHSRSSSPSPIVRTTRASSSARPPASPATCSSSRAKPPMPTA